MANSEEPQEYVLLLARKSVEARNTAPVLNVLTSEAFERADPQSLIGCLALYIDGYDDDPRELHEVPAVQVFFRTLEQEVPHILFYLSPECGSVHLFCASAWAKSRADGIAYIPTARDFAGCEDTLFRELP